VVSYSALHQLSVGCRLAVRCEGGLTLSTSWRPSGWEPTGTPRGDGENLGKTMGKMVKWRENDGKIFGVGLFSGNIRNIWKHKENMVEHMVK